MFELSYLFCIVHILILNLELITSTNLGERDRLEPTPESRRSAFDDVTVVVVVVAAAVVVVVISNSFAAAVSLISDDPSRLENERCE